MNWRILDLDPGLKPFQADIELRMSNYERVHRRLMPHGEKISDFANGYLYFGFHREENGWVFREWLPGADEVHLIGDFNGWNRFSHPLSRMNGGVWEIHLPGKDALCSGQHVKLWVRRGNASFERLPAYITRAVQDERSYRLCGQVQNDAPYPWTDQAFFRKPKEEPLIYEAHIGMAQEREGVGTYREFTENVLPRIAELGYNCVQLMAIQEHPYYGSFGYQVTNFFAASSRYGEARELKALINRAHELGIRVLLDVVHSHACPNEGEGLEKQDGTDDMYFLPGEKGWHPAWKTRLFDYSRPEVLHFLLSNLKYWLQEYHFDGFRFDGITSMLYHNHGLGEAFVDYAQYFSLNTNTDALTYLQLAAELVHELRPDALCIAEDMSGMPGMALPLADGGIGFDYRLGMGVPDFWIKLIKEQPYEQWNLPRLWYELTTRRPGEKTVAYCESHDQALVGDKTLIFRMADADMYHSMRIWDHSLRLDTAIDYHKLIRLITLVLGGEAYLNFMGNEFGHPEWIDFPREGNGWSHHYARRQWSLADNPELKYHWLRDFDKAMIAFAKEHHVLLNQGAIELWNDPEMKIMAFRKGELLYLFNFHPNRSVTNFLLPAGLEGCYQVIFSSDEEGFGGQNRVSRDYVYTSALDAIRGWSFPVYAPCRTAMVFRHLPPLRPSSGQIGSPSTAKIGKPCNINKK